MIGSLFCASLNQRKDRVINSTLLETTSKVWPPLTAGFHLLLTNQEVEGERGKEEEKVRRREEEKGRGREEEKGRGRKKPWGEERPIILDYEADFST